MGRVARLVVGLVVGALVGGGAAAAIVAAAEPKRVDRLRLLLPPLVAACAVAFGLLAAWKGSLSAFIDRTLLSEDADPHVRSTLRLVLVAEYVALGVGYLAPFLLHDPEDLPSFVLASRALGAGLDPYDVEVLRGLADHALAAPPFPYLYPPLLAVLLRPIAALPLTTLHALALAVNAALWGLLLALAVALADPPPRARTSLGLVVLAVFPLFYPAISAMHQGTPSLFIAVLVAAVFLLERRGASRAAGALLALATWIKVVPVLLVAYFLARRRFRFVAWTAVSGVALFVVSVAGAGVALHAKWLADVAPGLAVSAHTGLAFAPACHPENQSVLGVVCQVVGEDSPWLRPLASFARWMVALATAVVIARRRPGVPDALDAGFVSLALLLLSSISWVHHFTLAIVPIFALFAESARRPGRVGDAVMVVAMVLTGVVGFDYYLEPLPFVRRMLPLQVLRFDALVLGYVALGALCWRARRVGTASVAAGRS